MSCLVTVSISTSDIPINSNSSSLLTRFVAWLADLFVYKVEGLLELALSWKLLELDFAQRRPGKTCVRNARVPGIHAHVTPTYISIALQSPASVQSPAQHQKLNHPGGRGLTGEVCTRDQSREISSTKYANGRHTVSDISSSQSHLQEFDVVAPMYLQYSSTEHEHDTQLLLKR